ncbi:TIGR03617 family F420-dependent LLM class oxidoreductase [Streptomyces sp. NPDC020379]|uniref:TIGR03617 family F420-dependent LLM class oxidoreductase n=1 Tax=Streptomyces sp. NPDC020379 TaxID=3365071 RepID=UPI00379949D7
MTLRVDGIVAPWTSALWSETSGAAAACEEAGYGTFWLAEESHDPMVSLAAAAGRTSSIGLGSCVSVALARSPMTLAYTANDLHELSGGRFVLGLGAQVAAHLTHRFSMPADQPVARMREFVAALREIWACWNDGRPLDFRGRFYTHTLMPPKFAPPPNPYGPPPVFLAAIGRRMAQLAGECADGLIAPPFSSDRHLREVLLPSAERGLERSGRSREDFTVVCVPTVITGRTAQERAAGRKLVTDLVARSLGAASYRPLLELDGLGWLNDELVTLSLGADEDKWRRMSDLVDGDLLDVLAVDVPMREVGAALKRRYGGLADRIIMAAPYGTQAGLWDHTALGLSTADSRLVGKGHGCGRR